MARQHQHTINCCTTTAAEVAYAHGRDEERAAVVAFLRSEGFDGWVFLAAIERGEHRG